MVASSHTAPLAVLPNLVPSLLVMSGNVQPNAGGLTLTDYTVFKFPDGTLIAKSEVDIRETTLGQQGVTHLTGSFPDPLGNDIVWGSGAYAGATGHVRLSGGVDMSDAANGVVVFDCVFVIDLD